MYVHDVNVEIKVHTMNINFAITFQNLYTLRRIYMYMYITCTCSIINMGFATHSTSLWAIGIFGVTQTGTCILYYTYMQTYAFEISIYI